MSLNVKCNVCEEELHSQGAILLGPLPEDIRAISGVDPYDLTDGKRKKKHICVGCAPSEKMLEKILCNKCKLDPNAGPAILSLFMSAPDSKSEVSCTFICEDCSKIIFPEKGR